MKKLLNADHLALVANDKQELQREGRAGHRTGGEETESGAHAVSCTWEGQCVEMEIPHVVTCMKVRHDVKPA